MYFVYISVRLKLLFSFQDKNQTLIPAEGSFGQQDYNSGTRVSSLLFFVVYQGFYIFHDRA
jgi:hypothetical protein